MMFICSIGEISSSQIRELSKKLAECLRFLPSYSVVNVAKSLACKVALFNFLLLAQPDIFLTISQNLTVAATNSYSTSPLMVKCRSESFNSLNKLIKR